MSATGDFGKMVPGFDFLQGLMKTAGSALPSMGQWVAPTLDPDELNKRIEELRTVQFWLEQNARMIATTIQALEVQRMTLSTLKTMNLPVADLSDAFKLRTPTAATPAPARPAPAPAPEPAAAPKTRSKPASARKPAAGSATESAGMVDPMQWWGALTQQFTEIAAKAVKDSGVDAAKGMAGAMGQQAVEAASQAFKAASELPAQALKQAGKVAGQPARKTSRGSAARKR